MNSDKQHILNLIKAEVYNKNPHAEIILFGSQARQEEKKSSDWDILILLNEPKVDIKTEKDFRERLFEVELENGEVIINFCLFETRLGLKSCNYTSISKHKKGRYISVMAASKQKFIDYLINKPDEI